jgi:hypothetical protein
MQERVAESRNSAMAQRFGTFGADTLGFGDAAIFRPLR